MKEQGIVLQQDTQERIIDLLNYVITELFKKILCKYPVSIIGC